MLGGKKPRHSGKDNDNFNSAARLKASVAVLKQEKTKTGEFRLKGQLTTNCLLNFTSCKKTCFFGVKICDTLTLKKEEEKLISYQM